MMPVWFSHGSVELSSWVLMFSLGACVGFWLTYHEVVRKRLDLGRMLTLTVLAFAAGVIGARGLSWILYHQLYVNRSWGSILAVWDRGGMSMYGGLALAAMLGLAYIRITRLSAWDAADTLVVAWTPFISLLRVGCFLNGCCYGKPTLSPFGLVAGGALNNVNFGIPSHPTQLYATVATLGIFGVLWCMRTRRCFVGQLSVTFLVLYSTFRFFHEFLRGDIRIAWHFDAFGVLSLNQLLSLALFTFAIVAGLVLARRGRPPGHEPGGKPRHAPRL